MKKQSDFRTSFLSTLAALFFLAFVTSSCEKEEIQPNTPATEVVDSHQTLETPDYDPGDNTLGKGDEYGGN